MSDHKVLARITLSPQHRPTGFTRHYFGDLLPPPVALSIVKYEEDPGYYLFYLDESGREQTDTYHETFAAAQEQAMREFGVLDADWEIQT